MKILDAEVTLLINSNIDGINLFKNITILDFQFYVNLISTKLKAKAKEVEQETAKIRRQKPS